MKTLPSRGKTLGVTLIEVLVVIAIVGVLIGITVPALRGARGAGGAVVSLANLRSLGMSLAHYAEANAGRYPFIRGGEPVTVAPPEEGRPLLQCGFAPHWLLEGMWPVLMHDVAPWPEHFQSWFSPGLMRQRMWPMGCGLAPDSRGDGGWVSYRYSNSFIAAPRVWSGLGDATEDDIRPVQTSEVDHPSSKVVMYDHDMAYHRDDLTISTPRPVLLADGAAVFRPDQDASQPVQNPLFWEPPRIYHDTHWGVRGRDF